jgi:alkylated DNA repair dioxygenase AlkB
MDPAIVTGMFYRPNAVENPGAVFQHLWTQLHWEQREDAPRREAFYNESGLPYTYGSGRGERQYFPVSPLAEWNKIVRDIKLQAEAEFGSRFEACFCNGYEGPRQHLGWHADDSPSIDPKRPILVYSFGAKREIWIKPRPDYLERMGIKDHKAEPQKILLESGSLFYMPPGMQQTHLHRIPKHSQECEGRVSLTYRGLI